jgi:hypothetical protein
MMKLNDTTLGPASSSTEITRRSFMKKSALTAGAITVLGAGNGFANLDDSRIKNCLFNGCGGYTANTPEVYIDKPFGQGVTVTYFTLGKCKCSHGVNPYTIDAWEIALPPEEQEIYFVEERPSLQHTADHTLPKHIEH